MIRKNWQKNQDLMMDIGKWSEKGDQFLRSKTGKYGNRAEKRDKIILDRNVQNLSFYIKTVKRISIKI